MAYKEIALDSYQRIESQIQRKVGKESPIKIGHALISTLVLNSINSNNEQETETIKRIRSSSSVLPTEFPQSSFTISFIKSTELISRKTVDGGVSDKEFFELLLLEKIPILPIRNRKICQLSYPYQKFFKHFNLMFLNSEYMDFLLNVRGRNNPNILKIKSIYNQVYRLLSSKENKSDNIDGLNILLDKGKYEVEGFNILLDFIYTSIDVWGARTNSLYSTIPNYKNSYAIYMNFLPVFDYLIYDPPKFNIDDDDYIVDEGFYKFGKLIGKDFYNNEDVKNFNKRSGGTTYEIGLSISFRKYLYSFANFNNGYVDLYGNTFVNSNTSNPTENQIVLNEVNNKYIHQLSWEDYIRSKKNKRLSFNYFRYVKGFDNVRTEHKQNLYNWLYNWDNKNTSIISTKRLIEDYIEPLKGVLNGFINSSILDVPVDVNNLFLGVLDQVIQIESELNKVNFKYFNLVKFVKEIDETLVESLRKVLNTSNWKKYEKVVVDNTEKLNDDENVLNLGFDVLIEHGNTFLKSQGAFLPSFQNISSPNYIVDLLFYSADFKKVVDLPSFIEEIYTDEVKYYTVNRLSISEQIKTNQTRKDYDYNVISQLNRDFSNIKKIIDNENILKDKKPPYVQSFLLNGLGIKYVIPKLVSFDVGRNDDSLPRFINNYNVRISLESTVDDSLIERPILSTDFKTSSIFQILNSKHIVNKNNLYEKLFRLLIIGNTEYALSKSPDRLDYLNGIYKTRTQYHISQIFYRYLFIYMFYVNIDGEENLNRILIRMAISLINEIVGEQFNEGENVKNVFRESFFRIEASLKNKFSELNSRQIKRLLNRLRRHEVFKYNTRDLFDKNLFNRFSNATKLSNDDKTCYDEFYYQVMISDLNEIRNNIFLKYQLFYYLFSMITNRISYTGRGGTFNKVVNKYISNYHSLFPENKEVKYTSVVDYHKKNILYKLANPELELEENSERNIDQGINDSDEKIYEKTVVMSEFSRKYYYYLSMIAKHISVAEDFSLKNVNKGILRNSYPMQFIARRSGVGSDNFELDLQGYGASGGYINHTLFIARKHADIVNAKKNGESYSNYFSRVRAKLDEWGRGSENVNNFLFLLKNVFLLNKHKHVLDDVIVNSNGFSNNLTNKVTIELNNLELYHNIKSNGFYSGSYNNVSNRYKSFPQLYFLGEFVQEIAVANLLDNVNLVNIDIEINKSVSNYTFNKAVISFIDKKRGINDLQLEINCGSGVGLFRNYDSDGFSSFYSDLDNVGMRYKNGGNIFTTHTITSSERVMFKLALINILYMGCHSLSFMFSKQNYAFYTEKYYQQQLDYSDFIDPQYRLRRYDTNRNYFYLNFKDSGNNSINYRNLYLYKQRKTPYDFLPPDITIRYLSHFFNKRNIFTKKRMSFDILGLLLGGGRLVFNRNESAFSVSYGAYEKQRLNRDNVILKSYQDFNKEFFEDTNYDISVNSDVNKSFNFNLLDHILYLLSYISDNSTNLRRTYNERKLLLRLVNVSLNYYYDNFKNEKTDDISSYIKNNNFHIRSLDDIQENIIGAYSGSLTESIVDNINKVVSVSNQWLRNTISLIFGNDIKELGKINFALNSVYFPSRNFSITSSEFSQNIVSPYLNNNYRNINKLIFYDSNILGDTVSSLYLVYSFYNQFGDSGGINLYNDFPLPQFSSLNNIRSDVLRGVTGNGIFDNVNVNFGGYIGGMFKLAYETIQNKFPNLENTVEKDYLFPYISKKMLLSYISAFNITTPDYYISHDLINNFKLKYDGVLDIKSNTEKNIQDSLLKNYYESDDYIYESKVGGKKIKDEIVQIFKIRLQKELDDITKMLTVSKNIVGGSKLFNELTLKSQYINGVLCDDKLLDNYIKNYFLSSRKESTSFDLVKQLNNVVSKYFSENNYRRKHFDSVYPTYEVTFYVKDYNGGFRYSSNQHNQSVMSIIIDNNNVGGVTETPISTANITISNIKKFWNNVLQINNKYQSIFYTYDLFDEESYGAVLTVGTKVVVKIGYDATLSDSNVVFCGEITAVNGDNIINIEARDFNVHLLTSKISSDSVKKHENIEELSEVQFGKLSGETERYNEEGLRYIRQNYAPYVLLEYLFLKGSIKDVYGKTNLTNYLNVVDYRLRLKERYGNNRTYRGQFNSYYISKLISSDNSYLRSFENIDFVEDYINFENLEYKKYKSLKYWYINHEDSRNNNIYDEIQDLLLHYPTKKLYFRNMDNDPTIVINNKDGYYLHNTKNSEDLITYYPIITKINKLLNDYVLDIKNDDMQLHEIKNPISTSELLESNFITDNVRNNDLRNFFIEYILGDQSVKIRFFNYMLQDRNEDYKSIINIFREILSLLKGRPTKISVVVDYLDADFITRETDQHKANVGESILTYFRRSHLLNYFFTPTAKIDVSGYDDTLLRKIVENNSVYFMLSETIIYNFLYNEKLYLQSESLSYQKIVEQHILDSENLIQNEINVNKNSFNSVLMKSFYDPSDKSNIEDAPLRNIQNVYLDYSQRDDDKTLYSVDVPNAYAFEKFKLNGRVFDFISDNLTVNPSAILSFLFGGVSEKRYTTKYVCAYNVLRNLLTNSYGGEIITYGNSLIKPGHEIFINDNVNVVNGFVRCDGVRHVLNDGGYVMSIKPSLIVDNSVSDKDYFDVRNRVLQRSIKNLATIIGGFLFTSILLSGALKSVFSFQNITFKSALNVASSVFSYVYLENLSKRVFNYFDKTKSVSVGSLKIYPLLRRGLALLPNVNYQKLTEQTETDYKNDTILRLVRGYISDLKNTNQRDIKNIFSNYYEYFTEYIGRIFTSARYKNINEVRQNLITIKNNLQNNYYNDKLIPVNTSFDIEPVIDDNFSEGNLYTPTQFYNVKSSKYLKEILKNKKSLAGSLYTFNRYLRDVSLKDRDVYLLPYLENLNTDSLRENYISKLTEKYFFGINVTIVNSYEEYTSLKSNSSILYYDIRHNINSIAKDREFKYSLQEIRDKSDSLYYKADLFSFKELFNYESEEYYLLSEPYEKYFVFVSDESEQGEYIKIKPFGHNVNMYGRDRFKDEYIDGGLLKEGKLNNVEIDLPYDVRLLFEDNNYQVLNAIIKIGGYNIVNEMISFGNIEYLESIKRDYLYESNNVNLFDFKSSVEHVERIRESLNSNVNNWEILFDERTNSFNDRRIENDRVVSNKWVVDGDTFFIKATSDYFSSNSFLYRNYNDDQKVKFQNVRVVNINAAELGEKYSYEAANLLYYLLSAKKRYVTITITENNGNFQWNISETGADVTAKPVINMLSNRASFGVYGRILADIRFSNLLRVTISYQGDSHQFTGNDIMYSKISYMSGLSKKYRFKSNVSGYNRIGNGMYGVY